MMSVPAKKKAAASTMVYRRPIQSDVRPATSEPTSKLMLRMPARWKA
jgi:hypothetical protein